jgi:transposase-like protein
MTDERMALLELLRNGGGGDFLKELAETMLQRLMEWDVEGQIGAGRYERSDGRTTHRNGYRDRYPSFAAAATSRPSWSPAKPLSGRWSR